MNLKLRYSEQYRKHVEVEIREIAGILIYVMDVIDGIENIVYEDNEAVSNYIHRRSSFLLAARTALWKAALSELARLFIAKGSNCDIRDLFLKLNGETSFRYFGVQKKEVRQWERVLEDNKESIAYILLQSTRPAGLTIQDQQYRAPAMNMEKVKRLIENIYPMVATIYNRMFPQPIEALLPIRTIGDDAKFLMQDVKGFFNS